MANWLSSLNVFPLQRQYGRRGFIGSVLQLLLGFVQVAFAVAVFALGPFAWILRDAAYGETSSTGFEAVIRMFQCFHWGAITSGLLLAMGVLIELGSFIPRRNIFSRRDSAAKPDQTVTMARRPPSNSQSDEFSRDSDGWLDW
jgi:hypothetical protein